MYAYEGKNNTRKICGINSDKVCRNAELFADSKTRTFQAVLSNFCTRPTKRPLSSVISQLLNRQRGPAKACEVFIAVHIVIRGIFC